MSERLKSRFVAFLFKEPAANVRGMYIMTRFGRIYSYGDGVYVAPRGRALRAIRGLLQASDINFLFTATNSRDPQAVQELAQRAIWRSPAELGRF